MTSKEALERLHEKLLRYDEHYDYNDTEIIKQDLELLDILFKYCYGNIKTDCYLYIDIENMNQEEMIKVKEWYRNDK